MKTTLEIPDPLFRRAKSEAAKRGIPLREFVTEAITDKLRPPKAQERPWMQCVGKLHDLRDELARIDQVIDEEFEKIDPEDWQ